MMKKVFFIGVIFIIFLSPKQICAETTYDSNFVEINNSWYDEEYGDGHVYIPSYSNIGCVSDSENQIYLYYDYYGMDNNVVNQVFLDILEIYTYFCCELNYNNPISGSSQKFNIYFDYQSEFTDSKGYAQSNNPIFTLDYFGYIVINYDELLKDVISGFHINTLAHEFFHTICYRYEMSDNTGIIGWFMECSATAVGVKYYCDKFGIEKETLNSECELFCRGHMQQYLGTTNVSLVGSNANENPT